MQILNNKDQGPVIVRVTKTTEDESIGLAIMRHSSSSQVTAGEEEGIYIHDIFENSILRKSGLRKGMRILTINGETCTTCKKATMTIKSCITVEITAIPNDEKKKKKKDHQNDKDYREEQKTPVKKGWLW